MDKKLVERIKEYYRPEISSWGDFSYVLHTANGERVAHFNRQKKIVLTFGKQIEGDVRQMSDAELEEQGIVVTTEKELGKLLFPEHFERIRPEIEPDSRMEMYLREVKRNIGLIEIKHGWYGEVFVPVKQYDIWVNLTGSGYVDIGRLSDNLWVAQYSIRTAVDDFDVTRMYFNRLPSKKDIITAAALEDVETYFNTNGWDKAVTYCYACGREFHFCDIKARDLKQKFNYFLNHYCGCED